MDLVGGRNCKIIYSKSLKYRYILDRKPSYLIHNHKQIINPNTEAMGVDFKYVGINCISILNHEITFNFCLWKLIIL